MTIYRKPRTWPLPMLLTNNQRKMHGLPLHKKAGKGKRCKTRDEVMETVGAFLDYVEK